jgi:hypothetical protein
MSAFVSYSDLFRTARAKTKSVAGGITTTYVHDGFGRKVHGIRVRKTPDETHLRRRVSKCLEVL